MFQEYLIYKSHIFEFLSIIYRLIDSKQNDKNSSCLKILIFWSKNIRKYFFVYSMKHLYEFNYSSAQ